METSEAIQQRLRHEQQRLARLRLAMTRLADAEQERLWAIGAATEAGLSIRQIARTPGVSPTWIHQLRQTDEARGIPGWLRQLQDHRRAPAVEPKGEPLKPSPPRRTRVADEGEVFRWGIPWLERLEHADPVGVNLRPVEAEATACVPFDRPRVLRVLARMAADLAALAWRPRAPATVTAAAPEAPEVRHRGRVAEPRPPTTAESTGRACGMVPSSWTSAVYATRNCLWRCRSQN